MLFGSKFIRFMEGFKHKGSVTRGETEKGFTTHWTPKLISQFRVNLYCLGIVLSMVMMNLKMVYHLVLLNQ